MASNSAIEAFRPFIFQLPAISGRMVSVMSKSSESGFAHALAERKPQFQRPAPFNRSPERPVEPRLRGESRHFMMAYQFGDALLRTLHQSAIRFPPAKQVGPNASRNAQSLIKLARQDDYGRGDGRVDRQFRHLGHRRHLPRL